MLSYTFVENKDRKVLSTEDLAAFTKFKEDNAGAPVIGVHSGSFHADEVLATLLLKYHPKYTKSVVIRSRNNEILNKCDVVCDVGGEYNADKLRFDHHMKEFNTYYDEDTKIKCSSAGLIYKHFAKEILTNIMEAYGWLDQNSMFMDKIISKLYRNFILAVDAADNGVNAYPDDIKPKFLNDTHFSNRIARLNPEWNNPTANVDERFQKAWDVAEEELYYHFSYLANGYFIAYDIVYRAVRQRKEFDKSEKIIKLECYCPWKEILMNIEKEEGCEGEILYVIHKNPNQEYVISTVQTQLGSFGFRRGLPKKWRGLRGEELKKVSGIDEIVFVHASGFIAFAKTLDAAKKIANIALTEE